MRLSAADCIRISSFGRRTDGRTDGIGVAYTALNTASRGENEVVNKINFCDLIDSF